MKNKTIKSLINRNIDIRKLVNKRLDNMYKVKLEVIRVNKSARKFKNEKIM